MTIQEEHVETVDPRSKWGHEALEFTPWLAKNLDLLGEVLGLELEFVQTEKRVGPFYLDILAKEGENVLVAIENQLEETDFSHLGQLLTYATGCDARIAIWVAPEFTYEHTHALHTLNEWANGKIAFYGVKVEVYRRANTSCLEPKFRRVVSPGFWDKKITLSSGAMSPEKRKYHDFFQQLKDGLPDARVFHDPVIRFDYKDRHFPSRKDKRIRYAVYLDGGNVAWVTLHIEAEDKIQTKEIFDKLRAHSKYIEESIEVGPDPEWVWNRWSGQRFSSVNIRRDGSINDPPEKLEDTRQWMRENLIRFKDFFDNRLEELLTAPAPGGERWE
ncbi:MAG: DUF4268 domain-containing protein [Caldilineaceae bacterium]|nr:DUF4268 domain-containing protein [Caldilineaceae bacterium]